jgi:hypothetical protein
MTAEVGSVCERHGAGHLPTGGEMEWVARRGELSDVRERVGHGTGNDPGGGG